MDGLLLVDKPQGMTSHDVVARVRRAARTRRVGHAGTLDPFATGLLVIAINGATRLIPYLDDEPKVYEASVRFGFETDTDDATGTATIAKSPPEWSKLADAIASLTGAIEQVPPAFSAKHVDGERAYQKARRGEAITMPAVTVVVHSWQVTSQSTDTLDVVITCGGGTYVRALARDLGRALGSAAHCATLRRVQSGACHVSDAVSLEVLAPGAIVDGAVALTSPVSRLRDATVVQLSAMEIVDIKHGRSVIAASPGARAALLDHDHRVLAIAERTNDNRWQPRVVIPRGDAA